jgi:hypothetical protein
MEYELPRLSNCLGVDVAGDTFMMLWDFAQDTEKLAIGTLDISSRTAGQSPIDICPITKTVSEMSLRRENILISYCGLGCYEACR